MVFWRFGPNKRRLFFTGFLFLWLQIFLYVTFLAFPDEPQKIVKKTLVLPFGTGIRSRNTSSVLFFSSPRTARIVFQIGWFSVLFIALLTVFKFPFLSSSHHLFFTLLLFCVLSSFIMIYNYSTGSQNTVSTRAHQLLFLFISLLCATLAALSFLLFRIFHRIFIQHYSTCKICTLYLLFFFFLAASLFYFEWSAFNEWPKAFHGQSLSFSSPSGCTLPSPIFPHRYLLPRRFHNFFTGSDSCTSFFGIQRTSQSFASFISPTQETEPLLYIDCPHTLLPAYTPSADFFAEISPRARDLFALQSNLSQEKIPYTQPIPLPNVEYVRAFCGNEENLLIRHISHSSQFTQHQSSRSPNILFLMLDAVSRPQFMHSLPLTSAYLETHTSPPGIESNSPTLFQFFRFHVVGSHTTTNLTPMFLGTTHRNYETKRKEKELQHSQGFFWQPWKRALNYTTAFILEQCVDFFYHNYGIGLDRKNLTGLDHDVSLPFCHPDYNWDFEGPWTGPYSMRRRCIAGKYAHEYLIDYLSQFMESETSTPKFGFGMFMEGHESTLEVLPTIDRDLARFLEELYSGPSKNTITVIFGDHGNHMSPWFYYTQVGKIEHRLPLLMWIVPKEVLERYPDLERTMQQNQHKLVTPFDMYKTIVRLSERIGGGQGEEEEEEEVKVRPPLDWMYDLMNESIPEDRTCQQAHITGMLCICENYGATRRDLEEPEDE